MDFERADAINQAVRLLTLRHRARAAELLGTLGLHPGQEVVLLELGKSGPMIQAKLSDAIGSEPPSVTLMSQKLEAAGLLSRAPAPGDKRATVVELTDSGREMVERIKQLWRDLADETVTGLSADEVARLPALLVAIANNVDHRRQRSTGRGDVEHDLP